MVKTPAPVAEAPRLRDAGERLWRFQAPPPRRDAASLRLTRADADPATDQPQRCPGPFLACAVRAVTWNAVLELFIVGDRFLGAGACRLASVTALDGSHVCEGALEGLKVSFETKGDAVHLRLLGNEAFPSLAVEHPGPLVLQRVDALAEAFAAETAGGNRSPETRHLEALVAPLEQAAAKTGFGSPEGVRAALLGRAVDPQTVPQVTLRRLAAQLRGARLQALRLDEAGRQELFNEVVDGVLREPALAAAAAPPSPPDGRSLVITPGDGARPPQGATVMLAYQARARAGPAVESVLKLEARLEDLAPAWRAVLLEMSRGEARRVGLPDDGPEVELRLVRFGLVPQPPADLLEPPASATLAPNRLRYTVLEARPGSASPRPSQEVRVTHHAWNARGRLLRTTAWDDFAWWNSLEFVRDASLEVAAAHLLRIGERGRFWIPAEHPSRKGSGRPNDEVAVFEVQLLEVK